MKKNSICIALGLFVLLVATSSASDKGRPITDVFKNFKVENDQSEAKTVTVTTVKHTPTSSMYVVRGKVRYENVEGIAYLEMWNVLPDGSHYFSRTLGEYGTMQKIQGTSGWRDFELPFNLMNLKPESVTLEINVVMPGKGMIELSGLTVSDIKLGSGGTAGLAIFLGGILGGAAGLYGAILGGIAGILVPQGKGRRLVGGLFLFGVIGGCVLLVLGVITFAFGQPFGVYFPLAFVGTDLIILLPLVYLLAVKRTYAQVELRKMQALDV